MQYNTLVEVRATKGSVGIGSCYTRGHWSKARCSCSAASARRIGARAGARQREAAAEHVLAGARRPVEHAISGIDIALWDLMGKALGQPVSRLLGGNYRDRIKPYGSILFDEPDAACARSCYEQTARGFRAIKMGWRPFGRVSRQFDELLVRTARDTVGADVELMVDAGGSEQFWPHGYKWARETAQMLADYDITWFEEALPPDDLEGYIELQADVAGADRRGRSADAPASVSAVDRRAGGGHHSARLTKCGGLTEAPHRLAGLRPQHAARAARLEHGASGWRPTWPLPPRCRSPAGSNINRRPLHRRDRDRRRSSSTPTACWRSHGPGLGITLNREADRPAFRPKRALPPMLALLFFDSLPADRRRAAIFA